MFILAINNISGELTEFGESKQTGVDSQGEFYRELWGYH